VFAPFHAGIKSEDSFKVVVGDCCWTVCESNTTHVFLYDAASYQMVKVNPYTGDVEAQAVLDDDMMDKHGQIQHIHPFTNLVIATTTKNKATVILDANTLVIRRCIPCVCKKWSENPSCAGGCQKGPIRMNPTESKWASYSKWWPRSIGVYNAHTFEKMAQITDGSQYFAFLTEYELLVSGIDNMVYDVYKVDLNTTLMTTTSSSSSSSSTTTTTFSIHNAKSDPKWYVAAPGQYLSREIVDMVSCPGPSIIVCTRGCDLYKIMVAKEEDEEEEGRSGGGGGGTILTTYKNCFPQHRYHKDQITLKASGSTALLMEIRHSPTCCSAVVVSMEDLSTLYVFREWPTSFAFMIGLDWCGTLDTYPFGEEEKATSPPLHVLYM
jgi:hypothetical protein